MPVTIRIIYSEKWMYLLILSQNYRLKISFNSKTWINRRECNCCVSQTFEMEIYNNISYAMRINLKSDLSIAVKVMYSSLSHSLSLSCCDISKTAESFDMFNVLRRTPSVIFGRFVIFQHSDIDVAWYISLCMPIFLLLLLFFLCHFFFLSLVGSCFHPCLLYMHVSMAKFILKTI